MQCPGSMLQLTPRLLKATSWVPPTKEIPINLFNMMSCLLETLEGSSTYLISVSLMLMPFFRHSQVCDHEENALDVSAVYLWRMSFVLECLVFHYQEGLSINFFLNVNI